MNGDVENGHIRQALTCGLQRVVAGGCTAT